VSKDQSSGLNSFSKMFKVNRSSVIVVSALILILFVAFTVRMLPMRWEIGSGQVHLNEYDPYYQYSITSYMVENGLFSPYTDNWINNQQWYPNGLHMATSLPALPMTAAASYQIYSFFGGTIDLMEFCALLTVALGTLSCLIVYFIGKDFGGRAVGLFAALALALAPSFLQRSSLGFFDTEIPGMIGLLFFVLFFLRSLDPKRSLRTSLIYSIGAALALAYFICGWGAAYYVLGLTSLFVFAVVLLKRYDRRLLISYSATMGIGLLIAIQFPIIGLSYLTSAPVLLVAGVFIVLLLAEFMQHDVLAKNKITIVLAVLIATVSSFATLSYFGYIGNIAGKFIATISPVARASSPLIASVAEHRVTAWANLYTELGICALFFILGIYFILNKPTNRNIFLLIFGATGLYFGASMVRLLVIFAPAFALLMGLGLIGVLKPFMLLLKGTPDTFTKAKRKMSLVNKKYSILGVVLIFVILLTQFAFTPQTGGVPRAYSNAYMPTTVSAAGLPVVPNEQMTQWLDMLTYTSNNLHSTDVVVAWWDYGYWLSVMGDVTTLADNATIDEGQIENLAYIYMSSEDEALRMITEKYGQKNVQYILVYISLYLFEYEDSPTGFYSYPYGLADEGKWAQMARISGGARDRLISEGYMTVDNAWSNESGFGSSDEDSGQWMWNQDGMDSVIYKLMSSTEFAFAENSNGVISATSNEVTLKYLKIEYISGLNASYNPYNDLVPVVGLFKIDWAAYNAAHPTH